VTGGAGIQGMLSLLDGKVAFSYTDGATGVPTRTVRSCTT
jgi:hypothetical protein